MMTYLDDLPILVMIVISGVIVYELIDWYIDTKRKS